MKLQEKKLYEEVTLDGCKQFSNLNGSLKLSQVVLFT